MRSFAALAAVLLVAAIIASAAFARGAPHPREVKANHHFGLLCHE